MSPDCPRCGTKLWRELDPQEAYCPKHGTIYLGPPPLDKPVQGYSAKPTGIREADGVRRFTGPLGKRSHH